MSRMMSLVVGLGFLLLVACGPGFGVKDPPRLAKEVGMYHISPALPERLDRVKRIVVMPARIDVIQLTAGGARERMDQWSIQAQEQAVVALQTELAKNKAVTIQRASVDPRGTLKGELEETYALLDAVSAMIILHTYEPSKEIFPEKVAKFDYSLGPDVATFAEGADALLFLSGLDVVSTGGRKAAQAGMALLGLLGGVVFIPNTGVTVGSLALVDARDGSILAYKFSRCCGDLYEEKGAAKWVANLLDGFPLNQ